jgi:hypothetical protein
MANRNISEGRKTAFYVGRVLMVMGFLSFGSTFVSAAMNFGNFDQFEERGRSMALRAFLGMGLIVAGVVVSGVGARGLAGSGVVLDPEQARKDVEPWGRMAGGMIRDAIDETGIKIGQSESGDTVEPSFDDKLRRLHKLYEDGILTQAEYDKEKKDILDKI